MRLLYLAGIAYLFATAFVLTRGMTQVIANAGTLPHCVTTPYCVWGGRTQPPK